MNAKMQAAISFHENTTIHPTHFRAPLRHKGRDPETMGACRMTRVKTCTVRKARTWPT